MSAAEKDVRARLTRADEVVEVLRSGGRVRSTSEDGEQRLLSLLDADGNEIDAWQNAIKAGYTRWEVQGRPRQLEPMS